MLKRVIKIEKYLGLTTPQEEKDESCHAPENVYEHQIKVLTEDFKQEKKIEWLSLKELKSSKCN